jgi:DNA-binding transcriptional LysR family regulator
MLRPCERRFFFAQHNFAAYSPATMELRHLRYFVGVAETENVSQAAAKLHVSQPALSKQIRNLEDEMAFALFERTGKSVHLTRAGRTFLKHARTLLQLADEAIKEARAVADGGETELHIGYQPSPTARILPMILRGCRRTIPKVHIKLHDLTNDECIAGLLDGQLQLAFIGWIPRLGPLHNLRLEGLVRSHARLAVSLTHPLAQRDSVSLRDAAREPFVAYSREEYPSYHSFLKRAFATVKTKLRIVEEHEGASSLLAAIVAGTGVALVPDVFADTAGTRVKLLRVVPNPEVTIFGIAARKERLSPAAEKFWKCVKDSVAQKKSK